MDSDTLALFDPREAERHDMLSTKMASALARVEALRITDQPSAHAVDALLKDAALARKMAEGIRTEMVGPLNAQVKAINDAWRPVAEITAKVENACKRKLTAWLQAERERVAREQAEARRRQEEAARLQAEAAARAEAARTAHEFDAAVIDAAAADLALMDARTAEPMPAPRGMRSDAGTTSTRMRWTFKVTDAAAVPRHYLAVDEKAIRAAVAAGVRSIEGVVIYEDEQLQVRV